jgi:hypothetical protein
MLLRMALVEAGVHVKGDSQHQQLQSRSADVGQMSDAETALAISSGLFG